jgi:hypothetical protein
VGRLASPLGKPFSQAYVGVGGKKIFCCTDLDLLSVLDADQATSGSGDTDRGDLERGSFNGERPAVGEPSCT